MKNLEEFSYKWDPFREPNEHLLTTINRKDGCWYRKTDRFYNSGLLKWNVSYRGVSKNGDGLEELYQNPGMAVLYLRHKFDAVREYAKHILNISKEIS